MGPPVTVAASRMSGRRLMPRWRGLRGNREVSPSATRTGRAALLERERGSWGKQGFLHGTERPAGMPDAEDEA